MTVPPELAELKQRLHEVHDLDAARSVLGWDQMVMMPPGGADERAEHLATLTRLSHELFTRDEVGSLLDALTPWEEAQGPDDIDAAIVRVTRRDWEKQRRVPAALAAEMTRHGSQGMEIWARARAANDFASFRPSLERTLELKHEYVACFAPEEPYDALLDDFESGMRTGEVRVVFDRLLPELTALAAAFPPEADEPFLHGSYPAATQDVLAREVMAAFGLGAEIARIDPTVHPFCTSFGLDDIRITTRSAERDLHGSSVFSTMHEAGHGLYEHGPDPGFRRTPLAHGCSSALHESQSRLWENVIGRSLPFWHWFYPRFQGAFTEALGGVPVEAFHRAINRPRPSFIRVDADETTYGLHIILRFELEQRLLFGGLAVADLPEAWNARFHELTGLEITEDRLGCLQDVHWSDGAFGYFPTYQLGNVLSVQVWERLERDLPDAREQIERGAFGEIGEWLRSHLYRLGRALTPAETIERVCDGPIDPEPYLRYLRAKTAALA